MKWHIFDTGKASPQKNMEIDLELLSLPSLSDEGILHLYDWEGDCATYGYFTEPYAFLNKNEVKNNNLHLAKRPTGGGIIFHSYDFAFSFFIPASHPKYSVNTLDNYSFINSIVANIVSQFTRNSIAPTLLQKENKSSIPATSQFCMAKPTIFDVMIEEKKVGGGAQRRTKNGFLHQGSLCLTLPSEEYLQKILLSGKNIYLEMHQNSFPLLGFGSAQSQLSDARNVLRNLFINLLS